MLLLSPKLKENEVSVEWFLKLKEYDSLSKMRISHLKAYSEQEKRMTVLNERRQSSISELDALITQSNALQQELFEKENKITEIEIQHKRLIETGASDEKILTFATNLQAQETVYFKLLNDQEDLNQQRVELKTFLNGIQTTITEISVEVEEEKFRENEAISQLDLRLSLLLEELPSDFKLLLEKTLSKKLAVGSFTRVNAGACLFCKSHLSKTEESEIDMQHLLKTCKMCHRIFLPYGA